MVGQAHVRRQHHRRKCCAQSRCPAGLLDHSNDIAYIALGTFQTSQVADRTAVRRGRSRLPSAPTATDPYVLSAQNSGGASAARSPSMDP